MDLLNTTNTEIGHKSMIFIRRVKWKFVVFQVRVFKFSDL